MGNKYGDAIIIVDLVSLVFKVLVVQSILQYRLGNITRALLYRYQFWALSIRFNVR